MKLDSTRSLNIILAGAKTTLDAIWYVTAEDTPANYKPMIASPADPAPVNFDGTTNGVTAVVLVPAPSKGWVRTITGIFLYNIDTGSITPSFEIISGVNTRKIFTPVLATLENLHYSPGFGWKCYTTAGGIKNSV